MEKKEFRFKQNVGIKFYIPLIFGGLLAMLSIATLQLTMLILALIIIFCGLLYSAFTCPPIFNYNIILYKDHIIIEDCKIGKKERLNLPFHVEPAKTKNQLILDDDSNQISICYNRELFEFIIIIISTVH